MTQIDVVILAFLLFGGWLGAVKGPIRAFISLAGTVLGFAMAALYGPRLVPLWSACFSGVSARVSLQLPWVTAVSTQTAWRQSAYAWLNDLLWPSGLKQWLALNWGQLPSGETIGAWGKAVERGFYFALANICAFVTALVLTKTVVSIVAGVSFRLALSERQALSPTGFVVGLAQSALLAMVLLALLVPFFLWVGEAPIGQMLQPSLIWRAMEWLWNSILRV